jgi:opacity protein-like surface antigen
VKAEPSGQWGIAAGLEVQPGLVAKLSYVSMGTEIRVRDIDIANNREVKLSDVQNDWFLLGVQRYFKSGPIRPFAGGGLGLVVVSPKNESTLDCTGCTPPGPIIPQLSSNTYFAFNIEAGVNFMFSDNIGFNLQGNLYFPVNYGGFYVGTGGAGFSTGSTQIIGGFSGGLVFRIDN